jgi:biopolymer transport protein ExbB
MKKLIALFTLAGMLTFGASNVVFAQGEKKTDVKTEQVTDTTAQAAEVDSNVQAETTAEDAAALQATADENKSFHQVMKEKFIEGGAVWMAPILIVFILGLALVVERIIYLNLSTTNTQKLLNSVETALTTGGVQAAKEICKNTRGPLASIFFQGLDRTDEGIEIVEKSIVSYGGVLMARLEKNLSWIGLFIALGPMLGFLGTVVGMVQAFDAIEKAGDISPTVVAGGMKVALLTTVFGLIVAIVLQVFFSYLVTKVESIVNSMEDATISFMDILVKHNNKK